MYLKWTCQSLLYANVVWMYLRWTCQYLFYARVVQLYPRWICHYFYANVIEMYQWAKIISEIIYYQSILSQCSFPNQCLCAMNVHSSCTKVGDGLGWCNSPASHPCKWMGVCTSCHKDHTLKKGKPANNSLSIV